MTRPPMNLGMTLKGLSPNTQRTAIAAVKSLLSFDNKIGITRKCWYTGEFAQG